MSDTQEPKPGNYVEIAYRGVLAAVPSPDGIYVSGAGLPGGDGAWLPAEGATVRVIEPPEPTAVGTVVTGWTLAFSDRPEAMQIYVLTGSESASGDADGDGHACWQVPGVRNQYRWENVLEATKYGRRIIAPGRSIL